MSVIIGAVRDFLLRKEYYSSTKLCGKTVIITGGNAGIGKETTLDLAARGAKIIMACRDVEKGKIAAVDIQKQVQNANIIVRHLDLASFTSIRRFAEGILMTEPYIHILINNAGVMACPRLKTTEGFEMQFGVNYLGHFFLTNLLLDRMKESAPARIINIGSIAHILGKIHFSDIHLERGYNSVLAYCHSKLAIVLFTRELAKNLKGTGVTTYCVDPGPTSTDLFQNVSSKVSCIAYPFSICRGVTYKSPKKGAQTIIYCAVEASLAEESGLYYCGCRKVRPSSRARDDVLAKRLWDFSENLIATVG
ncbi:retinol dehydrogenase 11-like [Argiope bruennichi]|uniref:retinol dehydrogenase 11-like n=1 Tax=Argiope bruennichi TaxID=94029 RepID=UPI0024953AC0|nr:retinol dehydrogenase 11-like [Argiope bruennichi]